MKGIKLLDKFEPAKTLQDLGGVGGAVAKKGEEIYAGLSTPEQKIARRVFLKLVHLREGLGDTRQRTAIQDMIAVQDKPEPVIKVIRQFFLNPCTINYSFYRK